MGDPPRIIRYGGREVPVPTGATLLELLGGARTTLQRSIRYHRPRAPFCGIGHCTNCLVRVNGVPNVRACTYRPTGGERVQTENSWPSPSFDVRRVFDFAFPHGVDTTRGFVRPAFATPLFQRVVRRLAGYGRFPTPNPPRGVPPTGKVRSVDVAVVGAGRSGRAAARERLARGRSVELLDRRSEGENLPGATHRWGTTAVFLPTPRAEEGLRLLTVAPEGPVEELRPREVVIATGGYDAALWFAGADLPGVMTADGALAMAGDRTRRPFDKALVFGAGPRASALLERFGPRIDALASPGAIDPDLVAQANALGVELYPRSLVLLAEGRGHLRRVRLAPRGGAAPIDLAVDGLLLAHRRLPNVQLLFQAGARMEFDRESGAYFPALGADGSTSAPGVWAVGSCAVPPSGVGPRPMPPGAFEGYYREFRARPRPRGKVVVCPCEDVLLSELEEAHERGYTGIEVIKRYTGLGTGLCQGRYCVPEALLYLAVAEGVDPAAVGYLTQRPPVSPVPLGSLAALPGPSEEAHAP